MEPRRARAGAAWPRRSTAAAIIVALFAWPASLHGVALAFNGHLAASTRRHAVLGAAAAQLVMARTQPVEALDREELAVGITESQSTRTAAASPRGGTVRTPSGLQYEDIRVGTGEFPQPGTKVTVDYVMQTTGARYGSKIDSTKDREAPFSFVLGDKKVIEGLQEAVLTMKAGGIRRVFIPEKLGYTDDSKQPVPPGFGEFQRFKNIYLNPNRAYKPDLVFDLKLFKFQGS
mmetsp:Transcript_39897/g.87083  ORF Transcript_39897/g.87083 Transcript_39897/m.87083 type:complete len:232 (+) Transcript_39897:50-745(+)